MALNLQPIIDEANPIKSEEQLERETQLALMKYQMDNPVKKYDRWKPLLSVVIFAVPFFIGVLGYLGCLRKYGDENPISYVPVAIAYGVIAYLLIVYIRGRMAP